VDDLEAERVLRNAAAPLNHEVREGHEEKGEKPWD
jgi:hypothetical protein